MKKLLIILMLALASASAMAKWTVLSVNDKTGVTEYADLAKIRKVGNKVKMWTMHDHKTAQERGLYKYLSIKMLWEFDCQEEEARNLSLILLSGNMGMGDVVFSNHDPTKFMPIVPGSVGEREWNMVCEEIK